MLNVVGTDKVISTAAVYQPPSYVACCNWCRRGRYRASRVSQVVARWSLKLDVIRRCPCRRPSFEDAWLAGKVVVLVEVVPDGLESDLSRKLCGVVVVDSIHVQEAVVTWGVHVAVSREVSDNRPSMLFGLVNRVVASDIDGEFLRVS